MPYNIRITLQLLNKTFAMHTPQQITDDADNLYSYSARAEVRKSVVSFPHATTMLSLYLNIVLFDKQNIIICNMKASLFNDFGVIMPELKYSQLYNIISCVCACLCIPVKTAKDCGVCFKESAPTTSPSQSP